MENYDTMRYETASSASGGRRRQSARTASDRNNVIGGYSNLVRSNSYREARPVTLARVSCTFCLSVCVWATEQAGKECTKSLGRPPRTTVT